MTQQLTLDSAQGQRLKQAGQETVESRNTRWLAHMRAYAKDQSTRYGMVTTDDVRLYATSQGVYPTHHNAWGAVFRGHGWTCIGRKPSELATNHYREIRVWKWEWHDTHEG